MDGTVSPTASLSPKVSKQQSPTLLTGIISQSSIVLDLGLIIDIL